MLSYFPPIHPYATYQLPVEPPHQIYVEECGNPQGLPVLFLHGGPGGGCSENSRCLFNPNLYRIILFDQRGAGRSTPHGELAANYTQGLLADIETIRQRLNIKRWVIYGSSWGSLLGLVYAQAYPERVLTLILRAVFLNRSRDFAWVFGDRGHNQIFPDYWQEFLSPLPKNHHHNPLFYYYALLTGENEIARMQAAESWAKWEARCVSLLPDPAFIEQHTDPHEALRMARIECHYLVNNCFLEPDQVMNNSEKIQHIPSILIHGRYDMVCPLEGAWQLHQACPASELQIIPDAGHWSKEPGMLNAVIHATERVAQRLGA